jgi:hypothetical protein
MASQTQRVYWGPWQGTRSVNYDWEAINSGSAVVITAAEWNKSDPSSLPPETRFMGLASISVLNVVPHDDPGGVTFMINIEWDSPLWVCFDITVLDTEVNIDVISTPT